MLGFRYSSLMILKVTFVIDFCHALLKSQIQKLQEGSVKSVRV